jgi:hypothetical protein
MNALDGVRAVYAKEMLGYFRSPIAYFVIAVFLLGTGYFFTYNIFLTGIGTMDSTLQNMGILLLIISPVLTAAADLASGARQIFWRCQHLFADDSRYMDQPGAAVFIRHAANA